VKFVVKGYTVKAFLTGITKLYTKINWILRPKPKQVLGESSNCNVILTE